MEQLDLFSYRPPVVEPVPDGRFNGPVYEPELDHDRLRGQILRIFELMKDERWRTLEEIERDTGDPQASVSAQLRHLRKKRFGGHIVEKRRRGEDTRGLWEYRLVAAGTITN